MDEKLDIIVSLLQQIVSRNERLDAEAARAADERKKVMRLYALAHSDERFKPYAGLINDPATNIPPHVLAALAACPEPVQALTYILRHRTERDKLAATPENEVSDAVAAMCSRLGGIRIVQEDDTGTS